jgi:hypothetical protein
MDNGLPKLYSNILPRSVRLPAGSMRTVRMSECLECGESAKHMHPEYSEGTYGDMLCDDCYGGYLEDKIEDALEELMPVIKAGYVPRVDEYKLTEEDDD